MTYRVTRPLTAVGAAALLAAMLDSASLAAEKTGAPAPEAAAEDAAPQKSGDQSYEIKDAPDSPPVNYRSNEDARYDTPEQRDAEMYAEQYEKKRQEELVRQKKMLDDVNKLQPGGGGLNSQLGGTDDGFPSRSTY